MQKHLSVGTPEWVKAKHGKRENKQAWAELCQAQDKLSWAVLGWLEVRLPAKFQPPEKIAIGVWILSQLGGWVVCLEIM